MGRSFGESYKEFIGEGNGYRYFLQPLKDIHLHSELDDELMPTVSIGTIGMFGAIAVLILFLACVNFVNLSTALSVERTREVGIRKTFGSEKKSLVLPFLSESIIFSLASMLLAEKFIVDEAAKLPRDRSSYWHEFDPKHDINLSFLDQSLAVLYRSQQTLL